MTRDSPSDAGFYGESYDAYYVTLAHCKKKFVWTKNIEKVVKIHEYSKEVNIFCTSRCVLSYLPYVRPIYQKSMPSIATPTHCF